MLGLHCYTWAFSSCSEQGILYLLCVNFLLQWLILCTGSRVLRLQQLWCTGLVDAQHVESSQTRDCESISLALVLRFWTTESPGKSSVRLLSLHLPTPTFQAVSFPSGSVVKESANIGVTGDDGLILGQEDPWRRKWQPIPVFLTGRKESSRTEHTHIHTSCTIGTYFSFAIV